MRRRQSVDSSDEYELTDSETEYHSGLETELTDINDDIDEVIEDIEDIEDAEGRIDYVYLLTNEVYLLEYYLKQIEEFNESKFIIEDYSNSTTYLLN